MPSEFEDQGSENHGQPPLGFTVPKTPISPVSLRLDVAWGEMDSLVHVNHAVYLRWIENVRFWYFELVGINAYHAEHGVGVILAKTTVEYLAPVVFPDVIWLSTRVEKIGNTSFLMKNRVWSQRLARDVARGDALCVAVDYRGGTRSVRVPQVIRAAMQALDGVELEA
jgi:acyl-CoA thioester hydrolase